MVYYCFYKIVYIYNFIETNSDDDDDDILLDDDLQSKLFGKKKSQIVYHYLKFNNKNSSQKCQS
jgi:hypothetical protein